MHYYYLKPLVYSDFLSFYRMSFFYWEIASKVMLHLLSDLLGLSWAVTVSQTFLGFDGLGSFKECWSVDRSALLDGHSWDVSLMIRLWLLVWGGRSQR